MPSFIEPNLPIHGIVPGCQNVQDQLQPMTILDNIVLTMAPSSILFLMIVNGLLSFGSTLSIPASDSSLTLSAPNAQGNYSSLSGWTSFWISGDGSQIVPINGP